MAILSVKEVMKSFGNTRALDGISVDVDEGEIVALLGPSGCGKSTLLSVIAGLEPPDRGDVQWGGVSLSNTPPHLREFGLMFQDFALFPHMNVYANVAFGLKMAHATPQTIEQRVKEMLEIVGLPEIGGRDINTLSGGEQQRVALARALAPHPHLLMLDEPLGSLDRNLRERLVVDLQTILHRMHQTAIYVTHDQEEAFVIADRIILMSSGRIEQAGTPHEIYHDPATIFVARFLEMTNILPALIGTRDGTKTASTAIGSFPVVSPMEGSVQMMIRPDMARLDASGPWLLRGTFRSVSFRGSRQRITVEINQTCVNFDFPPVTSLPPVGEEITLSLDPRAAIKIFPG
jgi:ABC-type Fe3+/spermidine/putrescine transport system ATPase subunit